MTRISSIMSFVPIFLRNGLVKPWAMTVGLSPVKNSSYLADAVADNVLWERARKFSYPMIAVPRTALHNSRLRSRNRNALHVNRVATQVTILHQFPHPDHNMSELCHLARYDLEVFLVCEGY